MSARLLERAPALPQELVRKVVVQAQALVRAPLPARQAQELARGPLPVLREPELVRVLERAQVPLLALRALLLRVQARAQALQRAPVPQLLVPQQAWQVSLLELGLEPRLAQVPRRRRH